MMMLRKTKALLGLLVVLILINIIDGRSQQELEELPTISAMFKDDISKIEISTATEKIILLQEEGNWMLKAPFEAKADRSRIKSLILNFRKEIPMDALIDTNEENEYGLDAGNAIIIEIWTGEGKPSGSFLVGNDASYGSSFVRLSGSDAIYRARIGGRRRYDLSAVDWKNQQVFDLNVEDFQSVMVTPSSGEEYQVIRENGWTILPRVDGQVDEDRVDRAIKSLSMLRIGERVDGDGFVPELRFELSTANGEKLVAHSAAPEDGSVVITMEGQADFFRVASPAIERFSQGVSWFIDRRMIKLNTRAEIDLIGFKTSSLEIIIQQDLSTGFWNIVKPKNIDLDMREIFFMANTLASLEAQKEITEKEQYLSYFDDPPVTVSILTLMGGVTSIEITDLVNIDGMRGHLCRDKEKASLFLISVDDIEKILTGFGQADFFNK